MNENTLVKLSLLTSLIGILVLFILSTLTSLNTITIDDLSKDSVRLTGKVNSIKFSNSVTKIQLVKEDFIDILVLNSMNLSDIKKDSLITVEGKVHFEKEKRQILVDKISLIGRS